MIRRLAPAALAAALLAGCSGPVLQGVTSPDVHPHGWIYPDESDAFTAAGQFAGRVCVRAVPDGFVTYSCEESNS